jgi:PTH2 family peptidyl-tRNA hydrolase
MKMVLVVRQDIGMGKGKAAAQCAHAAVSLTWNKSEKTHKWMHGDPAQAKIVLKAVFEDMEKIAKECEKQGLSHVWIQDAGRTQIEPGTFTVLGIGPEDEDKLDKITGHLRLL